MKDIKSFFQPSMRADNATVSLLFFRHHFAKKGCLVGEKTAINCYLLLLLISRSPAILWKESEERCEMSRSSGLRVLNLQCEGEREGDDGDHQSMIAMVSDQKQARMKEGIIFLSFKLLTSHASATVRAGPSKRLLFKISQRHRLFHSI